MNEHAHFDELYERYLLGALDESEQALLADHLGRACPECLRGLQQARSTLAALSALAPDEAPSPQVRQQLLRAIAKPQPRPRWQWALSTAALLVLSIGLGVRVHQLETARSRDAAQRNQLQEELLQTQRHDRALDAAFALINRPETSIVPVAGRPQTPSAHAFVNRNLGVVLIARNLPPVTSQQTFELWLLPAKGKPIPAGLFQANQQNAGLELYRGPLANIQAIAVSVEPSGGSPQPTTTPILVAKLPA